MRVLKEAGGELLYAYLMEQVERQYERRSRELREALETECGVKKRREKLREDYRKIIGDFPEKTPLNASVEGKIECEGYSIEKVVYESRPGHHVTANLYLPHSEEQPHPGVLVVCGHSAIGKACEAYQKACILLARNGFVALIVDPICQGERYQFLDESGKPATRGGTTTHTLLDIGAKLVGTSVVAHEAWDNMRGIDYLITRPEVDGERIGCTGNSGGGTQTTFLIGLEDRIAAAAPSCYIMTQEVKFKTRGPADGCQQLFAEGREGIDQPDYLTMFAPKPVVILGAERDFFDIDATSEAYREAKRIYKALGHFERVDLFASDAEHGFNKPQREVMVEWMSRWLMGDNSPVREPQLAVKNEEELRVTKTGQVVSQWEDERTVSGLSQTRAEELKVSRKEFLKKHSISEIRSRIRELIGCRDQTGRAGVEEAGTINRPGYQIDKLLIRPEEGVPMPGFLLRPDQISNPLPAKLYLDGRGKDVEMGPEGGPARLVEGGYIVLSVDLRGFGETADLPQENKDKYWNCEHRNATLALHIGRPLLGQRVDDIMTALDVLSSRREVDGEAVGLVGVEAAGPAALHAAALEPRFREVVIRDSIQSWVDDVVSEPLTPDLLSHLVPGVLKYYDLSDLEHLISPRKVYFNST